MKKIIGVLLVVVMLISAMPVFANDTMEEVNLLETLNVASSTKYGSYSINGTYYGDDETNYGVKNTMDGKNTITYVKNTGAQAWIQFDFCTGMNIKKVTITSRPNNVNDGTGNLHIYLSNASDFTTDTVEMTADSYEPIPANEQRDYTCDGDKAYKYIRICNGNLGDVPSGSATVSFADIDVIGTIPAALDFVTNVTNATNVTDDIVITFNQPINSTTIRLRNNANRNSVRLVETIPGATRNVENVFTWTVLSDNKTVVIPVNQLNSFRQYELEFLTGGNYTVTSAFSKKWSGDKKITFTTGNTDKHASLPENAHTYNLLEGKLPTSYSSGTTEDYVNLTDGNYSTTSTITKDADGEGFVTYDLSNRYDIYAIELCSEYGGYSLSADIIVYGSNNVNNPLDTEIARTVKMTSDGSYEQLVKLEVFDTPESYRYITVYRVGSISRLREIVVKGAVTTTLKDQTYDILAGNISKADDGAIVATTGVTNIRGTEATTGPKFILALYNEIGGVETLVDATVYTAEPIATGAGVRFDDEITIPASDLNGKTYTKARLFAFDATDGLTPICKPLTESITNN